MTVQTDTHNENRSATCDLNWLRTTPQAGATRNQTAQLLGVDPRTVSTAVARGEIPSVRIGQQILIPIPALRRMFGIEDGAA